VEGVERLWLDDGSWVDVVRGWLPAERAASLFDEVVTHAPFRQARLFRYERYALEPRLTTSWSASRPGHRYDGLVDAQRSIQARYGVRFDGAGLNLYRDGRDSVAFHRDRDLRWLDDTVTAILTLGAARPFLLRPRTNRYDHDAPHHGATHDVAPRSGDLLVMGGRAQADWEHSVPKAAGVSAPRVSVQWRWTARTGRPVVGASYRAPRTFSR
jgi:alkylated DNA repair dioxygenase AlkB